MPEKQPPAAPEPQDVEEVKPDELETVPREYGGPRGREPTRYGDWEKKGRCIDF